MSEVVLKKLPEDWAWSKLGDVVTKIIGGGTPSKNNPNYWGSDIPWFTVKDMRTRRPEDAKDHITEKGVEESSTNIIPADTVIIATRIGLGKVIRVPYKAAINQDLKALVVPPEIEKGYLEYWFVSKSNYLESIGSGTTVKGIRLGQVRDLDFPLAPPEQQKRIVAKIEELFSHIDAGIEALKKAKQLLKQYRQSVLKAAVSGEITKEWREANGNDDVDGLLSRISDHLGEEFSKYQTVENKKGWIKVVLKDISTRVSVGHVGKTSEFYCEASEGIPFLRSQNVRPGKVVFKGSKYITKDFHNSLKKSQLQIGDLLIVRVGANRGDATVMPEFDGEINCANIVFARTPKELASYLDVYFQSKLWTDLVNSLTTGSAQGVINTKTVEKVELEIPSVDEMKKIFELVEEKDLGIRRLENEIDSQLVKADISKQSILASSFSGGL